MELKHLEPNKWAIVKPTMSPAGMSFAKEADHVLLVMTDAELHGVLASLKTIDEETGAITAVDELPDGGAEPTFVPMTRPVETAEEKTAREEKEQQAKDAAAAKGKAKK